MGQFTVPLTMFGLQKGFDILQPGPENAPSASQIPGQGAASAAPLLNAQQQIQTEEAQFQQIQQQLLQQIMANLMRGGF